MISVECFDLGLSAMSGQPLAFYSNYSREGNAEKLTYSTPKGRICIIASKRSRRTQLNFTYSGNHSGASAKKEITERFALNEDITRVYKSINTDPFMDNAITELNGLRVTRNDPWETTLCFVISQFNNIKRIRGIVGNLKQAFGEEAEFGSNTEKLFPTPEALASASLSSIRKCGTGFRDKYIQRVARECSTKVNLEELYDLDYGEAKAKLLQLDGIGDKVADCILLFGYGKLDAFPIDTWVKRVIETAYFRGKRKSIKEIHEFADKKWPGLQGYSNQYIFWHGRTNRIGK
jgi:N-glycosylase/DNA lyase